MLCTPSICFLHVWAHDPSPTRFPVCNKHFRLLGPKQWQAANTKVPRREEERKNIAFCSEPPRDSQLSSHILLALPLFVSPHASLSFTPPCFPLHLILASVHRCWTMCSVKPKRGIKLKFSWKLPLKLILVHWNHIYSTLLHQHHVNNPLTFTL